MKQLLFTAFLLIANLQLQAQMDIPWELERFEQSHYQVSKQNIQSTNDETVLFAQFYRAYKQSRTENPDNYFPELTSDQLLIKSYLSERNSSGDLVLLANFLEKGSKQSLKDLAQSDYQSSTTLPYRFLAAMVDKNVVEAGEYLNLMNQNGMISPVLKAWGWNATSNGEVNIYMTHGLQDLIGVSWGLLQANRLEQVTIFNGLINTISDRAEDENAFLRNNPGAWISPTFNTEFLEEHLSELRLSGIGFKLEKGLNSGYAELDICVDAFRGLDQVCSNPADVGLVKSYKYLLDGVELILKKENRDDLESFQTQLSEYIEQTKRIK